MDKIINDPYFTIYLLSITGSMLLVILLTLIYQNIELRKETKRLIELGNNQRRIISRNRIEWLRKGIDFDDEDETSDSINIHDLNKFRNVHGDHKDFPIS